MRKPQGGKIFTADAPNTDNRKNDKRRNNAKDKDKNNRRDFMYEEDGNGKGKGKSKVGAFVKPEKKPVVEEEEIKVITVPEEITIKELADKTDEEGKPVYAPYTAWSYADVVTGEDGKPVFSAIKKNSEYKRKDWKKKRWAIWA